MKLYERFGETGYHTSFATTFGINFDAYESVVLPRLRGGGCHNNVVFADRAMLTQALDGSAGLPRFAGRSYSVSGIKSDGAFHPKLFLQLGRDGGRIIVSSANLTPSGLAGNVELGGELVCGSDQTGEQQLVAQAWNYLLRILPTTAKAVAAQVSWAETHTPWLRRAPPSDGSVTLSDGTQAALLATGGRTGIAQRFVGLIGDLPVKRLMVISPYWDERLEALQYLIQHLRPKRIAILVDPMAPSLPKKAASRMNALALFDRGNFRKGRFIHAKAIIAQTRTSDHVLYGSANCTMAAIGKFRAPGINDEVCLYREFPAGTLLEALELETLLNPEARIHLNSLPDNVPENGVDLRTWGRRAPGLFECQFETLIWTPPDHVSPDAVTIELLNADGEPFPCSLVPHPVKSVDERHFLITGTKDRPKFARLRFEDGGRSPPAVVMLIDAIRELPREPRPKPVEKAIARLSYETEFGLWLLDLIDMLEAAERGQRREIAPISITQKRRKVDDSAVLEHHRTLSYEAFIAGRRPPRAETLASRDSLGGSDLSLVRGFMNRVLGISSESADSDERPIPKGAFDLGDETSTPEKVLADAETQGVSLGTASLNETMDAIPDTQRQTEQRDANLKEITWGVETFVEQCRERRTEETLTTSDILRLRVLLTIVAAAGFAGEDTDENPRTMLQVLPVENDDSDWPRALGRLLFGFFGGNDPVVKHIAISAMHDQITDDILESWATCFWAVQACLNAPVESRNRGRLFGLIRPVAERVYRLTGLTCDEASADIVHLVMDRLNQRFTSRLGLDREAVTQGHAALISEFLGPCNVLQPSVTVRTPVL